MPNVRTVTAVFVMLLLLIEAGCSRRPKDQPTLGEVSGTVTLDGEPLTNAIIHFIPSGGRESVAILDNKGNYVLGYLPKVPGAKIGNHKVVIKTYFNDEASPEAMFNRERIPNRYNTETTLTAEVKAGKNEHNFTLTTK